MFLRKLTIKKCNVVIREIIFRKGLNLIIDETDVVNKKKSGNSVGKTTVIRLIDFCLGGDSKNIYSDLEFKSNDTVIEKFLKDEQNNILIVLVLKANLIDSSSDEITIERNFLLNSKKIQRINGKTYNDKDFRIELNKLLFHRSALKPTFRQMISKNIRHEKARLDNVLKILNSYSKKEEYETLILTWLGINIDKLEQKQDLLQNIKLEKNTLKAIQEGKSINDIEQSLIILDKDLLEKENRISDIRTNTHFEVDFKTLNLLKKQINYVKTSIVATKLRIDLIEESKTEIESQNVEIDASIVKDFYQEAKLLLPNLQKKFEDLLNFHKEMSKQKIAYITKELPALQSELQEKEINLRDLLTKEQTLSEKLNNIISSDDYNNLIIKINELYERKGAINKQRDLIKKSEEKLSCFSKQLGILNSTINSKIPELKERITKFNEYFCSFSSDLYDGEKFILSFDTKDDIIEFNITTVDGNMGTGKKRVQIAAFDLAYIKFAEYYNIPHLNFVIYDQIENIHGNQLNTLLVNLVDKINCQYIAPVLKDKLPSGMDVETYKILTLSQDDKLFKI